jgi:hypothetical protein
MRHRHHRGLSNGRQRGEECVHDACSQSGTKRACLIILNVKSNIMPSLHSPLLTPVALSALSAVGSSLRFLYFESEIKPSRSLTRVWQLIAEVVNMDESAHLYRITLSLAALYKIVVGEAQVGKSCLIMRFANDQFTDRHKTTLALDFRIKAVKFKNKTFTLQLV